MVNVKPKDNIFKVPEVPKRREPEEIAFEEEVVTQVEEYYEEEEEYLHEEEELITEEEVVPVIPVKGRLCLLTKGYTAASLESRCLIWSDSGAY